jgi:hypothetical protein
VNDFYAGGRLCWNLRTAPNERGQVWLTARAEPCGHYFVIRVELEEAREIDGAANGYVASGHYDSLEGAETEAARLTRSTLN